MSNQIIVDYSDQERVTEDHPSSETAFQSAANHMLEERFYSIRVFQDGRIVAQAYNGDTRFRGGA